MKSVKALALLAGLSIAVAACGGHGGSSVAPTTTALSPGNYTPTSPYSITHWNQEALTGATYLGRVSNAHMNVFVLVHQQGEDAVVQYAREVSDPSSPNFRHFLTPDQIADRFGATLNDYQTAANYFVQQGLTVGAWSNRMLLSVSGPQAKMEQAFGTAFGAFSKDGREFLAPLSAPHFTRSLPVDAVGRLVSYDTKHTYLISNPPRAGNAASIGYSPQQVRNAFGFTSAYNAGYDGTGVTIGIIGTGPIDVNAPTVHGDRDLDAYSTLFNNVNVATVQVVPVTAAGVSAGLTASGIPTAPPATPNPTGAPSPPPGVGFPFSPAFQSPPPVTASCSGTLPTCNPEDGEAQLDVQQIAGLAPGATVKFYLAYNASDCATYFPNPCATPPPAPATPASNDGQAIIGLNESDAEIMQAIGDNNTDVLSLSYGGGENQAFTGLAQYNSSFSKIEFAELATEGIAVFVSSGDSGSAECLSNTGYLPQVCVSYPSGDDSVVSVGGVTAALDPFGQLEGPIVAWGISTANNSYGGTSGSGGGTSTFMPAPSWQASQLGATMREQPDVSMIGDPSTGVAATFNAQFGGSPGDIGGTSVAAPEMAAMWGLVLHACKLHPATGGCPASGSGHYWRLGNAAPYLYAIYKGVALGGFTPQRTYAQTFYDVLYGSNEMAKNPGSTAPATPVPGAIAMTGYDQVTGVGVPYASHLIDAITGLNVP